MSDGVQRAATVLPLHDSDERLFAAAGADGPDACLRDIRAAEAADPTGQQYPRTKPSDDASLVVWDVDGA